MKITILAAAALVALPALLLSVPAEAITSRQFQAQGHGRYLNSSGTPVRGYRFGRYRRHHHFRHRHHTHR